MPLVTTNQAVKDLFGIEASEPLRSKANTYLRNGVIPSESVVEQGFSDASIGKRGKKLLNSVGVDCLFNALLLDAFFTDTKLVKSIFDNNATRALNVALCEEVLLKSQSVSNVAYLSKVAQEFLNQLSDESLDLRKVRLVCPFTAQRLPQMDMALQNTGLLYQMLRSQRLSLSVREEILLCWLEQDLYATAELSEQVDEEMLKSDAMLSEILKRARQNLQEAKSFNSLLNCLPK
ncbi:hypothetical protein L1D54_22965 [Vibrio brasiliensis]|uniref:hypothetical protein n=1 Tax=Vibrio brasiliensis TaxID=170652 RepID=UPI001EFE42B2|nr:hypothetical protein [Vibrio brasiliensis]MCG9753307.1 hypothetical protein [Vibrio brasiliensis]